MKPLPSHTLYLDLSLSTFLYLPAPSPPIFYHRPDPYSPYVVLFPFSPAFFSWLRAAVAALRVSDPAQVARNHHTLMAIKEYAQLRYTATELSSANPADFSPPAISEDMLFTGEELSRILDFSCEDVKPSVYVLACSGCSRDNGFTLVRPQRCAFCNKRFPSKDWDTSPRRLAWREREEYVPGPSYMLAGKIIPEAEEKHEIICVHPETW